MDMIYWMVEGDIDIRSEVLDVKKRKVGNCKNMFSVDNVFDMEFIYFGNVKCFFFSNQVCQIIKDFKRWDQEYDDVMFNMRWRVVIGV